MKRIPFNGKENVYDKLVVLQGGEKTCNKKIPSYENAFYNIPYYDYIKILPVFIKYTFSCDERNRENFSKIGLRDFIKKKSYLKILKTY